jgi:hypothetical protein
MVRRRMGAAPHENRAAARRSWRPLEPQPAGASKGPAATALARTRAGQRWPLDSDSAAGSESRPVRARSRLIVAGRARGAPIRTQPAYKQREEPFQRMHGPRPCCTARQRQSAQRTAARAERRHAKRQSVAVAPPHASHAGWAHLRPGGPSFPETPIGPVSPACPRGPWGKRGGRWYADHMQGRLLAWPGCPAGVR